MLSFYARLVAVLLCLFVGFSQAAPKKTDAQIKEQKTALKKLESDLAKKRKEIAQLENEERKSPSSRTRKRACSTRFRFWTRT